MPAKFVLKKTANGQFHFMLLATNGRVVASSEMYKTKAAALNGIESIRKNAGGAVFEDKSSSKA
ncbi:MAG TPA: YegP family protein [Jatrophihabitantaceae bacterium]|nr:YegP family protein [Jatrophihabitantaceae bacterium]